MGRFPRLTVVGAAVGAFAAQPHNRAVIGADKRPEAGELERFDGRMEGEGIFLLFGGDRRTGTKG